MKRARRDAPSPRTRARTGRPLLAAGLALACAAALGCHGRPRAGGTGEPRIGPAIGEVDLSRGAPESPARGLFGPSKQKAHPELVRALEALPASSDRGVFVRLGSARFSLARAHEVGRLLAKTRALGRPVVCHADELDNATLLLSSLGCSRVWVSPAGGVDSVGLAAQLLFANRLLTRLKVDVDFLQVGKFKGASEPFTRDAPSPEARASLEGALRGLRAAWLDGITKGRPGVARDAPEDGPFAPAEAKARGLIDGVGTHDEARDEALALAGAVRGVARFGGARPEADPAEELLVALREAAGATEPGTPRVAIVSAVGAISMGGGGGLLGGGDGITEQGLGRTLRRVGDDDSVKAVVLRIDSPGGSALASDLLWKRLRKVRAKKPLVVSVGGMAASGGYYLSAAGTRIFAEETSIVGSIGVVGGKLSVQRSLEELGVHVETIAAAPEKGARAAYLSPFAPWDDGTRARVDSHMRAVYDLFLDRIVEGRSVSRERVAESAEGRIFGGREARERGLVDELGGLSEAIAAARALAKLPDDAPVELSREEPSLGELLMGGDLARTAVEARLRELAELEGWLSLATGSAAELSTFLGAYAPLLAGETTLVAAPFALVLR